MRKNKSLKKLTDFEYLSSVREVRTFLKANPDKKKELADFLLDKLGTSYANQDGKEYQYNLLLSEVMEDEQLEKTKNLTYESNHYQISAAIHNHITKYRNFPAVAHISEITKLSRQTVYKHLKDGIGSKYNAIVKGKIECMANAALEQLYLIGIEERNANALKSFIELSGAIKKQPAQKVQNFIQINNLKLSQEDIQQLPIEVIEGIEELLMGTLTIRQ